MTLPELCIRRPVMTTLLMAAFIIFGAFGYKSLPVSELPNVEFPTIQVQASLPGADPETMATFGLAMRDAGATIVGACCGSTPDHLRAMTAALRPTPAA